MAMTLSGSPSHLHAPRQELTPAIAIRIAWFAYVILLFIPFALFIAVIWAAAASPEFVDAALTAKYGVIAMDWFIGSMAYLAVVVPCAIFWRSHVFQAYWRGERVPPSAYLNGMLSVWISLEIGGILSLIGCLVSGTVMPGLIPAAVALMLFTPLWPSGRAMLSHKGHSDDPEKYSEPS